MASEGKAAGPMELLKQSFESSESLDDSGVPFMRKLTVKQWKQVLENDKCVNHIAVFAKLVALEVCAADLNAPEWLFQPLRASNGPSGAFLTPTLTGTDLVYVIKKYGFNSYRGDDEMNIRALIAGVLYEWYGNHVSGSKLPQSWENLNDAGHFTEYEIDDGFSLMTIDRR